MRLHRIVLAEFGRTAAEAFSGKGGLIASGRWHSTGRAVVYASQSEALAALEVLVHLQRPHTIAPFLRWEIDIPERYISTASDLAYDWHESIRGTRALGDAWLSKGSSLALVVPSILVSSERNCLINPAHPKFDLTWVTVGPTPFAFDGRFAAD